MKRVSLIALCALAFGAFSTAQACEYMNKTMTLNTDDAKQISEGQSSVLDQGNLVADTVKKQKAAAN